MIKTFYLALLFFILPEFFSSGKCQNNQWIGPDQFSFYFSVFQSSYVSTINSRKLLATSYNKTKIVYYRLFVHYVFFFIYFGNY